MDFKTDLENGKSIGSFYVCKQTKVTYRVDDMYQDRGDLFPEIRIPMVRGSLYDSNSGKFLNRSVKDIWKCLDDLRAPEDFRPVVELESQEKHPNFRFGHHSDGL